MPTPRVCVLRAPGTNCDVETAHAFEVARALPDSVHLFRLLEQPHLLNEFQILCIPGGFSYGDDIGAGVIFSRHLRGRLAGAITEFLQADKLALGICNGFQVLLKSGILPSGRDEWPPRRGQQPKTTLTWNDNGKYTAVWVSLAVHASRNVFLRGLDHIELPIAHAEGKLVVRDRGVLQNWHKDGQIALCYQTELATEDTAGDQLQLDEPPLAFPANPNGSVANIAGLGDPSGRVLGLMPHPERYIHATQHPQWTRRRQEGEGAGLKLFQNAVAYFG